MTNSLSRLLAGVMGLHSLSEMFVHPSLTSQARNMSSPPLSRIKMRFRLIMTQHPGNANVKVEANVLYFHQNTKAYKV